MSAGSAAVGALGLGWLLAHLGWDALAAAAAAIGAGFLLTCLAHLAGLVLDSVTLRATAGREGDVVGLLHYIKVSVSGHAINEATPLGKLGEVTKLALLSQRLAPARATSALVVQNVVMFVTNCALIAIAAGVALAFLPLAEGARTMFAVAACSFATLGAAALWLLGRGVGDLPVRLAARLGAGDARLERVRDGWRHIEAGWRDAVSDRRRMIVAWSSAFLSRGANVIEGALILHFLGADHIAAAAVLSLAVGQLVFWMTSFVPLQAGTAEGGSYLAFTAAGLAAETGVVVELVRKLRRLVFIGIGVTVLGVQSIRRRGSA